MIICETANGIEVLPKRAVKKIVTGEKFVSVHVFKPSSLAIGKVPETTIRRFHSVIVDGIKVMANEESRRMEEEKEDLLELKGEIDTARKDIDELKKQIDKNGCMIGRMFGKCGKKKD